MIPHFPYLGMPHYNGYSRYGYRYPYYSYKKNKDNFSSNNTTYNIKNSNDINRKDFNKNKNVTFKKSNICNTPNDNINKNCDFNEKSEDNNDSPLFQIFGINIFFDDILIICLIWFLYDEGVKDEGLFIALILLLLS